MPETRKYKRFSHSPFNFEWNGVKIQVDKNGKVVLIQEHSDETYDEITTSAALIYRLASMLSASKKVTYTDEPFNEST